MIGCYLYNLRQSRNWVSGQYRFSAIQDQGRLGQSSESFQLAIYGGISYFLVTSGVLREIWIGNQNFNMKEASSIVALRGYPNYPTFRHVVENFTTPGSTRAYYGQRLRSLFHAPESGNYKFTINCPYACDFYFTYKHELTKKLFDISTGQVKIVMDQKLYQDRLRECRIMNFRICKIK